MIFSFGLPIFSSFFFLSVCPFSLAFLAFVLLYLFGRPGVLVYGAVFGVLGHCTFALSDYLRFVLFFGGPGVLGHGAGFLYNRYFGTLNKHFCTLTFAFMLCGRLNYRNDSKAPTSFVLG